MNEFTEAFKEVMANPGCDMAEIITKAGHDCLERNLEGVRNDIVEQMRSGKDKQEVLNEMVIMIAAKSRADQDHMAARSELGVGEQQQ